jgi:ATP/maltotriose-dependent transcriptional regulator MalT
LTTSVRLLGAVLTWAGRSKETVDALASAIEVVEPVDPELALFLEADLAAHAQLASRDARSLALKRLERHAAVAGATRGERLVLASLAFERARASTSDREAVAHLERALAGGRLLDEQELDVPPSIYMLVAGLLATEAVDLTDAVLDRMLAKARAVVSVPGIALVLAHQGVAFMRRGAVARAEADARAALDLLVSHGIPLGFELTLAVLVEALVGSGDLDAAERALTDHGFDSHIRPGMPTNALLEARAVLRVAQGRAGDALSDLLEFGRRDEVWGGASPLASRWRSRASLVLAALGRIEEARQMALDDLDRAQRWGAPGGIGVALRACALVDGGATSLERLQAAVEVLAASPARLEHAQALADLGAVLRRANRRREARRVLGEGLQLAERCHASALAARVRTELRAAGAGSSTRSGIDGQSLTASERRVAELAAEGRSNPEIAQSLFVTRKTVETHLGSVYRKLGITRRGRLPQALAERT